MMLGALIIALLVVAQVPRLAGLDQLASVGVVPAGFVAGELRAACAANPEAGPPGAGAGRRNRLTSLVLAQRFRVGIDVHLSNNYDVKLASCANNLLGLFGDFCCAWAR